MDFAKPISTYPNTGGYYNWLSWTGNSWHVGVDFYAPEYTEVFAVRDGTVVRADWDANGYGEIYLNGTTKKGPVIVIEHKDDNGKSFYALYGHVDYYANIYVGQKVKKGQPIGKIIPFKNKDNSNPHLHFGIRLIYTSSGESAIGNVSDKNDTKGFVNPVDFLGSSGGDSQPAHSTHNYKGRWNDDHEGDKKHRWIEVCDCGASRITETWGSKSDCSLCNPIHIHVYSVRRWNDTHEEAFGGHRALYACICGTDEGRTREEWGKKDGCSICYPIPPEDKGGGSKETVRVSEYHGGTGKDYRFTEGWYPDLSLYGFDRTIDFVDTSGTIGVLLFSEKNYQGTMITLLPNKSASGNCAYSLQNNFNGVMSKRALSMIASSDLNFIKNYTPPPPEMYKASLSADFKSGIIRMVLDQSGGTITASKIAPTGYYLDFPNDTSYVEFTVPANSLASINKTLVKEISGNYTENKSNGVTYYLAKKNCKIKCRVGVEIWDDTPAPVPDPKIIMANAKQNSVEVGETLNLYIKTNDAVTSIKIIDGNTELGSVSTPSTSRNGEREWDIEIKATSSGNKTLKIRAFVGDKSVDATVQITITEPAPINYIVTKYDINFSGQTKLTLNTDDTIVGQRINDSAVYMPFIGSGTTTSTVQNNTLVSVDKKLVKSVSGPYEEKLGDNGTTYLTLFPSAIVTATVGIEIWKYNPTSEPPVIVPPLIPPAPTPTPPKATSAVIDNGISDLSKVTKTTPLSATLNNGTIIAGRSINNGHGWSFDFTAPVQFVVPQGYICTVGYDNATVIDGYFEDELNDNISNIKAFPGATINNARLANFWFSPDEKPPSGNITPAPVPPASNPAVLTAEWIATDLRNNNVAVRLSSGRIVYFTKDKPNSVWVHYGELVDTYINEVFDCATFSVDSGVVLSGNWSYIEDGTFIRAEKGCLIRTTGFEAWHDPEKLDATPPVSITTPQDSFNLEGAVIISYEINEKSGYTKITVRTSDGRQVTFEGNGAFTVK